ncbi:DinB family protein [Candidatus Mycobacterium wuenschmannii]|uniref:DinB family protein n=1 Tax=Candidatus Mycobacterium wuenschmannii TaxID=3027808 RepID=A0ABY8VWQ2_9MYCO|nr:DinB family protein [Candidatus Mycobacterium wuenschmannii]WIM87506.1 DinB family protein [Candidatus Mycobacterium wuenschmannii]
MPALASPVADERSALREFLAYHQSAFFAVAYGLTDEQARSSPTVSDLSVGGLIKHVTAMQRTWMSRVAAAPDAPRKDPRPFDEIAQDFADQHVMRPDETLDGLLENFRSENAKSLQLVDTADLEAKVPVPQDIPWFPKGIKGWSVRWVILHVINELTRHSGHADIVRESIDGATMYELLAALEGWSIEGWVQPWRPSGDA